ncbi:enoyl-CoA hydratase [Rhizodiscina lignyota]|uniref:Enoyl-CoA hydratase n=1 Tax=Rhizodiscina lignyota TaxID=1504668 RepID=A0A9P4M5Q0_9PEZI|nr:enoyl-CoA hydratase [Rhizodiscina lignyota]
MEASYGDDLLVERRPGNIFVITMKRGPENRLNVKYCQKMIKVYHDIQNELGGNKEGGPDSDGAVILKGNDYKYFTTGLDLDERDSSAFTSSDGFYPLLHTIVDFPYPTIALITGHVFGGACLLAMSHDYRIMNSRRGFFSMPPANLGLHFDGMGSLLRAKLAPQVARKVLLEAHKFTGKEAFQDGVVDAIAEPEQMFDVALQYAEKWKSKSKMGVYGVLRNELLGDAAEKFQKLSYVHSRPTNRRPKLKL